MPRGNHVVGSFPADAYDGQVMRLEDQVGPDSRGKPAGALLLPIAIAQHTEGSPTISDLNKVEQRPLQPTTNGKVPGLSPSDLAMAKVGRRCRVISKGIRLWLIGCLLHAVVPGAV